MSPGKIFFGIILVAVGFFFVWKTEWLQQNFGGIGFAEKHLGSEGGSRLMYKVIGTLIIVIGILYITDLSDNFLAWIAGSMTR
ncbi:hypothetical protein HOB10_02165 [Candidatus Parcubacteria bacterium]|jgi:hypothetical protein|nr:hypothetical protein [Candidatus Parcubacteria bacterium]